MRKVNVNKPVKITVSKPEGGFVFEMETLEMKLHVWLWYTLGFGTSSCCFLVKLKWKLVMELARGFAEFVASCLVSCEFEKSLSYCWW